MTPQSKKIMAFILLFLMICISVLLVYFCFFPLFDYLESHPNSITRHFLNHWLGESEDLKDPHANEGLMFSFILLVSFIDYLIYANYLRRWIKGEKSS
jgi:hypothetical protein